MTARALLCTLPLLLGAACSTASLPQIEPPLRAADFADEGALQDSSAGTPIAFYANPALSPTVLEVSTGLGTTQLHVGVWTLELARQLNQALARRSRFDERFGELAPEVFAHEVENGDLIFAWKEPEDFAERTRRMRIVRLQTTQVAAEAETGGVSASGKLQVTLPDNSKLTVTCDVPPGKHWPQRLYTCFGERLMGNPTFWQAVSLLP